uniref:Proline-rich protein 12 n=1 Tax=Magallana gigas TaxID=29159 RepID=K1Q354_MAGGI
MDPNQWRNFNTPYGQPPGVGSSAELPRLELVTQQTVFSPGFGLPQGPPGLSIPSHHGAMVENPVHGAFGLPKVSIPTDFTGASMMRSTIGEPFSRSIPPQYTSDALKSSQEVERGLLNLMNSHPLSLDLSGPPPAHSGSTNQSISRNPLAAENLINHQPFSMKLQNQAEPLRISVPTSKVGYSEMRSPTSTLLYGLTSPGLEDRSHSETAFSAFSSTQTSKAEQFNTSHGMNYDPVSPVSDVGQQNDDFAHMDFQDLTQMDPSRNSMKLNQNSVIMQHINDPKSVSRDMGSDQNSYMSSHNFMHGSPSFHGNHGVSSPVHRSPHNVSPHVPSSRESPQVQPPSSSVSSPMVQTAPDPRTKSKKSNILMRSRSGDESSVGRSQLQDIPPMDCVDVPTSNQNYNLPGNYSYCAPKNHAGSPQSLNSFSPQSYSPHMHQSMQGSYQNIQNGRHSSSSLGSNNSPVINDYTSLPQTETKKEPRAKATRGRRRKGSIRRSIEMESEDLEILRKRVKVITSVEQKPALTETKSEPPAPGRVFSLPVFRIGDFVIAKSDLNNFECFPIWRIDPGKMMKKYELFTDKGKILHMATCTYSSCLPKMDLDYIPVKVTTIRNERDGHIVEVHEADRPKPKLDSRLETEYEEDPLADMFNVYLQIFLSCALEPGFLMAILDSKEEFYLGPLNSIDDLIDKKLIEIDAKVQWKQKFKACRFASEPALKSVHLFGQSYDHKTLVENKASLVDGSMEFLIGKTASLYVMPYHSLYHFKYNLSKRCQAKVDLLKQANSRLANPEILDKCLNNRVWVLKIFDDLKTLLEKG